jgi:hypothetical protein
MTRPTKPRPKLDDLANPILAYLVRSGRLPHPDACPKDRRRYTNQALCAAAAALFEHRVQLGRGKFWPTHEPLDRALYDAEVAVYRLAEAYEPKKARAEKSRGKR